MKKFAPIFFVATLLNLSCNFFSKNNNSITVTTKVSYHKNDTTINNIEATRDTNGNILSIKNVKGDKMNYLYEKNLIRFGDENWYLDDNGRAIKMIEKPNDSKTTLIHQFQYDSNGYLLSADCSDLNSKKRFFVVYFDYSDGNLINIQKTLNDNSTINYSFNYYNDKKSPSNYYPFIANITQSSFTYFISSHTSVNSFSLPANFLGRASKNLIKLIFVKNDFSSESYLCDYDETTDGRFKEILITGSSKDNEEYYCKADVNYNNYKESNIQSKVLTTTKEQTKTLDEVKLTLLDGRCEKAELLLGKPDYSGAIKSDITYYMFYLNKVVDNGQTKNLLLLIDSRNGINETSPIYRIDAVQDGQTDYGVANAFIWMKINGNTLTSNCGGFTCSQGSLLKK